MSNSHEAPSGGSSHRRPGSTSRASRSSGQSRQRSDQASARPMSAKRTPTASVASSRCLSEVRLALMAKGEDSKRKDSTPRSSRSRQATERGSERSFAPPDRDSCKEVRSPAQERRSSKAANSVKSGGASQRSSSWHPSRAGSRGGSETSKQPEVMTEAAMTENEWYLKYCGVPAVANTPEPGNNAGRKKCYRNSPSNMSNVDHIVFGGTTAASADAHYDSEYTTLFEGCLGAKSNCRNLKSNGAKRMYKNSPSNPSADHPLVNERHSPVCRHDFNDITTAHAGHKSLAINQAQSSTHQVEHRTGKRIYQCTPTLSSSIDKIVFGHDVGHVEKTMEERYHKDFLDVYSDRAGKAHMFEDKNMPFLGAKGKRSACLSKSVVDTVVFNHDIDQSGEDHFDKNYFQVHEGAAGRRSQDAPGRATKRTYHNAPNQQSTVDSLVFNHDIDFSGETKFDKEFYDEYFKGCAGLRHYDDCLGDELPLGNAPGVGASL